MKHSVSASTFGTGDGVAAWFNGRAKQVTPKVIASFREQLPEARVYVTDNLDDAKRAAERLARTPPRILFCGGGDGTIMRLLNLLREAGAPTFPTIALLKLGTGNGFPNHLGAPRFRKAVRNLSALPWNVRTKRFDMVDVDGTLCHFAGAGWDATLLSDYQRNLASRKNQLVGGSIAARLNKGLGGYLYSLFRFTVPEDFANSRKSGRPRVRVESLEAGPLTLDRRGRVVPTASDVIYDGVFSIACAGTEPEWGARFRAFPSASAVRRRINFRVYDREALEGVRNMFRLWKGERVAGMHDYFVTRVQLTFNRPMPFQIAGDPIGLRESIVLAVAQQTVDFVDWRAVGAPEKHR